MAQGQLYSYNNALAMVSFVDGHVKYIRIYYNGLSAPLNYNPIPGYEYQWTVTSQLIEQVTGDAGG